MRTGAIVPLIMFVVSSMHAQVVLDRVDVPDPVRVLQVVGEREFYMLPLERDRLYHASGDFRTWWAMEIPKIWEKKLPWYVLSAFADGEALLTFTEWNATRDTFMLGLLLWRDSPSRWTVDRCPYDERLPNGASRLTYAGDSISFAEVPDGCLRSTDFGRTWTQVPALAGMKQPSFIGGGRGWAFQSTDTLSVIARTTDRGETWSYDTLRVRLTGLNVEFDGSVFAHIHDTIPPQTYHYLGAQEEKWREISYPFVTDFDGRTMQWQRMDALSQGRFLAVANFDTFASSLFLSEDAGAHWTRLQNFRELPSPMWNPIDWRIRDLWRISPTEFLYRESLGESPATMTLTRPSPMTATVENYSTTRRRQLLLRWSDPFGGEVRTAEIERSGADSSWLMIANSTIQEQEYLDSTLLSATPLRYRVTLHAADGGVATAVTDSVTPILGAYVDYLDYLLPSVDKVLRYHAVDIRGQPLPARWDTTFTTVTLRFLTPWDSTALMRIHPVLKIVDSINGKNDSTYGRIVEYRTPRHDFQCDDVYPGLEFPTFLPWASLFIEAPGHPGLMKQELLDAMMWMFPDSLDLFTSESYAQSDWSCRYRMQEGIGVVDLMYKEDGFHGYKDHRVWTLIEHVNASDPLSFPAAGLVLSSYPNPLNDGATVRYILPTSGEATLTVHDLLGRRVALLAEGRRSAGTHHAAFHVRGLPPGTYLLRLTTAEGSVSRLISLIR